MSDRHEQEGILLSMVGTVYRVFPSRRWCDRHVRRKDRFGGIAIYQHLTDHLAMSRISYPKGRFPEKSAYLRLVPVTDPYIEEFDSSSGHNVPRCMSQECEFAYAVEYGKYGFPSFNRRTVQGDAILAIASRHEKRIVRGFRSMEMIQQFPYR